MSSPEHQTKQIRIAVVICNQVCMDQRGVLGHSPMSLLTLLSNGHSIHFAHRKQSLIILPLFSPVYNKTIMIKTVFIKLSLNPMDIRYANHPMTVAFNTEEEMNRETPLDINVFTAHLCPVLNTDSNQTVNKTWTRLHFRGTFRPKTFP